MSWKELGTKDRWLVLTAGLQAAATIGTFLVAMVGIWKVTPIITYQVQQQEARVQRATQGAVSDSVTDRFSADAVGWWEAQVASYQRILDLTRGDAARAGTVSFEVVAGGASSIAPGVTPDLLVVTAKPRGAPAEIIKVPVNEGAMPPSQYLQCRVNQGVFAKLDSGARSRVEIATQRYIQRYMVPGVPPAYVRTGMSLKQLHDEITLHQQRRVEALQHLVTLRDMLEEAAREPR